MEKEPDMDGIKFDVTAVEDGNYGSLVGGFWNGMIKELRDGVRIKSSSSSYFIIEITQQT